MSAKIQRYIFKFHIVIIDPNTKDKQVPNQISGYICLIGCLLHLEARINKASRICKKKISCSSTKMTRYESYDTDLKVIQKDRKISGVDPYKLVVEYDSTPLS